MSLGHATEERRRRLATLQREAAWEQAREWLAQGKIGQAVAHLRAAYRQAWEQYERPQHP